MSKFKIQNKSNPKGWTFLYLLKEGSKIQMTNPKTKVLLFVICALVLFCYLCFGICHSAFAQEEKFFEIKAKKFSYTPHIIKVKKGDLVKIRLISEDVHHGFFLDGYGIDTSAYPGADGNISFIANKTGRFSFRCSVTCGEFHPYMIGYLIVEPNSRFFMYAAGVLLIGFTNLLFITFRKKEDE